MTKPKTPFPSHPTPEIEEILEISGNPRAPRAVVGGIQRDGTIIRLGEGQHLDEIASLFIHHPAELDGCLPTKPLRKLAGYVVAVDAMAERTDTIPGGPRRQPARLVCIGGHGHSPVGWARFIDQPDEWHLMHDLGELEEFTAEMLSELRWYQMRVSNTR